MIFPLFKPPIERLEAFQCKQQLPPRFTNRRAALEGLVENSRKDFTDSMQSILGKPKQGKRRGQEEWRGNSTPGWKTEKGKKARRVIQSILMASRSCRYHRDKSQLEVFEIDPSVLRLAGFKFGYIEA